MSAKTLIIGHRGAAAVLPENTMESFRLAFHEHQADMIEFDLHLSKNGVPVILHDAKLERTTNGRGFVAQKTLSYLKSLDAGRGFKIPTLEEVLAEFGMRGLSLEIKAKSEELVHACMKLVRKYKAGDIVIGSKHNLVSRVLEKDYPGVPRFCSRQEILFLMTAFQTGAKPLREKSVRVASVPPSCYGISFHRREWIDFLHAKGLKAFFWTIDDPLTMRRLRDYGADGIITNNPGIARKTLSQA